MSRTKMFVMTMIGSLTMGAAVAVRIVLRRRHARRDLAGVLEVPPAGGLDAPATDAGISPVGDGYELATESGIANVDPQPLAQVAGEGIDPDLTEQAHHELVDLHDRLRRP